MATTTTDQGIRIPEATDDPNVPDDIQKAVADLEKKLVRTYANIAERDAKNPSPSTHQVAFIRDTDKLYFWEGLFWVQMYPPVLPSITSGTAVPSNTSGANGDIFFKV